MSECCFAKLPLRGTFTPRWPFATELYGRLLYLRSGQEQVLLCAFDSLNTWASDTRKFRKAVSAACGIPEKSIIYHELQAHAAPNYDLMHEGMDRIIERAVALVNQMKKDARPFRCEVSEAYFGTECSFNREQYIEGLGGVTVWTGMTFDEQQRPCTNNKSILLLQDYRPELDSLKQPVRFDNPNDPLAYLFLFRDSETKEVLGSLSRFAAHPDVGVLFELRPGLEGKSKMYHYDFDWPGYLSSKLERDYGGISMYVNGPCADLSTKKGYENINSFEESDAECRRLGEWFAEKLEQSFAKHRRVLQSTDFLKTETFTIKVPMREDMPRTLDEAKNGQQAYVEREKAAYLEAIHDPNRTPAQVKHQIDEYWKALYNGRMAWDICGFDEQTLAKREVTMDIPCVQFADYLFVGLPGESLTEMATWLRSTFTGSHTIPLDQCNGYYSYMATPRSLTLGGYTYWCSWTTRDTIPSMQEQLVPLIHSFLED